MSFHAESFELGSSREETQFDYKNGSDDIALQFLDKFASRFDRSTGRDQIVAGNADVVVAGGMENMSATPYLIPKARTGLRLGHG